MDGKSIAYGDYCRDCEPLRRVERWDELARLVWIQSTVQAAAELGISDVALDKQCCWLGVPKPPPGFWRKHETDRFIECRALVPPRVQALLGPGLDEVYPLRQD
ncbi:MAG: hypothetical protein KKA73_28895 [Chloroflexi bacterium]|nr:hypothetical protein [Chloroflexota bacterium]MBU1751712.1 hypothetical protein [Chloroflexota bacterium]